MVCSGNTLMWIMFVECQDFLRRILRKGFKNNTQKKRSFSPFILLELVSFPFYCSSVVG